MKKSNDLIGIGLTSRFSDFVFKNVWKSLLLMILSVETVVIILTFFYNEKYEYGRGSIVALIFLVPTFLLIQLATKSWCYKILVDVENNIIYFYEIFSRGEHTVKNENFVIIINSYCNIFVGGHKFTVHSDFIHDLVAYLPKDTVIKYEGRVGKYKEKNWLKGPLLPGNKLVRRKLAVSPVGRQ